MSRKKDESRKNIKMVERYFNGKSSMEAFLSILNPVSINKNMTTNTPSFHPQE